MIGAWFGRWYVTLRGPSDRAYYSERNRIRCRVVPLGHGWRIVVRTRPA